MIYLIFSSIEFLLWFLPIFLIVYGITPHKYRNLTLLIGSIVFYAMGDAGNLAPLMLSVLCNYFIGLPQDVMAQEAVVRDSIEY